MIVPSGRPVSAASSLCERSPQKARWISAVHAALARQLGPLHDTSYVQVQDVRAAAWGYGGRTQEARSLVPAP